MAAFPVVLACTLCLCAAAGARATRRSSDHIDEQISELLGPLLSPQHPNSKGKSHDHYKFEYIPPELLNKQFKQGTKNKDNFAENAAGVKIKGNGPKVLPKRGLAIIVASKMNDDLHGSDELSSEESPQQLDSLPAEDLTTEHHNNSFPFLGAHSLIYAHRNSLDSDGFADDLEEDGTQEDVTLEDVTQEDVTREDVTQENVTQGEVTQENVTQEDLSRDHHTEEAVTLENHSQEDGTWTHGSQEQVEQNVSVDAAHDGFSLEDVARTQDTHEEVSQESAVMGVDTQEDYTLEDVSGETEEEQDLILQAGHNGPTGAHRHDANKQLVHKTYKLTFTFNK